MVKRLIFLGLIVVIVFSWFFFFGTPDAQKVTKNGPVIFLGNSITAGVGTEKGKDFPSLISQDLGLDEVINAGVSGDTTKGTLRRLQADVLDKKPSLVVIELGGNDFLAQTPPEEVVNNLENIVAQIKQTKAAIILVYIKYPRDSHLYEKGYKEIAKKYQVGIVWNAFDGILNNPELMADSLHPNNVGHKKLAERITPHIKKLMN